MNSYSLVISSFFVFLAMLVAFQVDVLFLALALTVSFSAN